MNYKIILGTLSAGFLLAAAFKPKEKLFKYTGSKEIKIIHNDPKTEREEIEMKLGRELEEGEIKKLKYQDIKSKPIEIKKREKGLGFYNIFTPVIVGYLIKKYADYEDYVGTFARAVEEGHGEDYLPPNQKYDIDGDIKLVKESKDENKDEIIDILEDMKKEAHPKPKIETGIKKPIVFGDFVDTGYSRLKHVDSNIRSNTALEKINQALSKLKLITLKVTTEKKPQPIINLLDVKEFVLNVRNGTIEPPEVARSDNEYFDMPLFSALLEDTSYHNDTLNTVTFQNTFVAIAQKILEKQDKTEADKALLAFVESWKIEDFITFYKIYMNSLKKTEENKALAGNVLTLTNFYVVFVETWNALLNK